MVATKLVGLRTPLLQYFSPIATIQVKTVPSRNASLKTQTKAYFQICVLAGGTDEWLLGPRRKFDHSWKEELEFFPTRIIAASPTFYSSPRNGIR